MITHFIGIGGIGMSGLARLLLQKGEQVSGSDLQRNALVERLEGLGAHVQLGQDGTAISQNMRVVYSSAVGEENPEMQAARRLGCPVLHRSELLAELTRGSKLLAVTGTHGKTTTSSILAWLMQPVSYAVGGVLAHDAWNAAYADSPYFVAEADESDGSMLSYQPHAVILCNSEPEHLDHYGSFEKLQQSYKTFCERAELCVWCADDANLQALRLRGPSFGFGEADFQIQGFQEHGWVSRFHLQGPDGFRVNLEISLPGRHNVLNAAAAFILAWHCGQDAELMRKRLASFPGVGRRSQRRGEPGGILLVDDYAHHPTELAAAIQGVRQAIGQRRLIAVYQPHRYTRTRDCRGEMADAFAAADRVYVTEIYAAGQEPIPGISHECVIEEVSEPPIAFLPRSEAACSLAAELVPGDVLLSLGAGDITQLATEVHPLLESAYGRSETLSPQ